MGISGVTLPPDPVQNEPTYESALAAFEKAPPVRVLFDNGAGGSNPGEPYPGFEQSFASFPVPGTRARSWYLAGNGALTNKRPKRGGTNSFAWNPNARPHQDFSGDTAGGEGGLWTATPPYKWVENPAGTASSFITEPLVADTTVVGPGLVKAWITSSKPNVDLQATVTEVRKDGKEVFVQNGYLRSDARKLDAKKSTPLAPVLSLRERDAQPLPKGRYVPVTIPLYYQGHPYRAGSRIRVTLSAVNGDQPVWAFAEAQPKGTAKISIAFSKKRPSGLTLPVVPNVVVPAEYPPCPGLRGQPCRDYQPPSR
jgi:predicted acyl esterase